MHAVCGGDSIQMFIILGLKQNKNCSKTIAAKLLV